MSPFSFDKDSDLPSLASDQEPKSTPLTFDKEEELPSLGDEQSSNPLTFDKEQELPSLVDEQSSNPLIFDKEEELPSLVDEQSSNPLTFDKEKEADAPSLGDEQSSNPLTFDKEEAEASAENDSESLIIDPEDGSQPLIIDPEDGSRPLIIDPEDGSRPSSVAPENASQPDFAGNRVRQIFQPTFELKRYLVQTPSFRATLNGVETNFDLRADSSNLWETASAPTLETINARLSVSLQRLQEYASQLDPNLSVFADANFKEGWTYMEKTQAELNEAFRAKYLTLAGRAFEAAAAQLTNEKAQFARFAFALTLFYWGDFANGLATLETIGTQTFVAASGDAQSNYWTFLRLKIETRDLLATIAGQPQTLDYWRERSEFFQQTAFADATAQDAERQRQAFELRQATELLATDLATGVELLRRATQGPCPDLNFEAVSIYERSFGEKPDAFPADAPSDPAFAEVCLQKARAVWTSLKSKIVAPEPDLEATNAVNPAANPAALFAPGARWVLYVRGVEFAVRRCPAGTFAMGSPDDEAGRGADETRRLVTITDDFWTLETPVTQQMWTTVMGSNPSALKPRLPLPSKLENSPALAFSNLRRVARLPVESVSWNDCQRFLDKLADNGCAPKGWRFRLPTEAEWEYACRAGSTTPFFWGANLNGDAANCNGREAYGVGGECVSVGKTTNAGRYPANAWGLSDMHGNVWEWCADWQDDYSSAPATDPTGPSEGELRAARGGCYSSPAKDCRSAKRNFFAPTTAVAEIGFRIVLERVQPR